MSDDLLKRLRNTPNWMREEYAHYKDGLKVFDRAPFEAAYALEAQAAEITRLRAERNAEISARFKAEGEFSTMQRRIARQRRALAKMYQRRHDKNAALATARRDALAEIKQDTDELIEQGRQDGMEKAAQIADATAHANRVEYPKKWKDRPEGIPHDWSVAWETCAETAEEIAAAIRTAALDPAVSQSTADLVATARREGMKDAAKWHDVRSMELSGKAGWARNFRQLLRQSDFHMESAAAIRAAAGEVK